MYSDQLLSKQGPLAHVWLAANYDKKLSKQQLLNANIVDSSKILSTHPISYQISQDSQFSSQSSSNTITLRLSGQLLLGIVRIYSRKTKYLLDDVNDVLFKLKNSFKYANGGVVLGSDGAKNQINLAPQQTVVSNVANIILTDQVADFDLLYQDDLNLDDDNGTASNANILFSQIPNNNSLNDSSFNFDQSIEMPRYNDSTMNNTNNDDDLELDFDLDGNNDTFDQSIETGRNAEMPYESPNISILSDLNKDGPIVPDSNTFGLDFDNPLETIDEPESNQVSANDNESVSENNEPVTPPPTSRPRVRLVGITEEGLIKTTKRKLKVDSLDELDTGISIQDLRDNQRLQLNNGSHEDFLSIRLSETEKLKLINELSYPTGTDNKRRKLWNIDDQLQQRCFELSREEQNNEDQALSQNFDDFDNSLDFDISLPGLESEPDMPSNTIEHPSDLENDEVEIPDDIVSKSTFQIADQLREVFSKNGGNITNLTETIERDLSISEREENRFPLGVTNKSSDNRKINKRREATKCFFELLVLATNDCISIDQEQTNNSNDIGGNIDIRSRDKLFNQFV